MKTVVEARREIPVIRETDVLVVGGGPAGLAASVAAARCGARVTLVERYGCLGGLATGGLVIWLPGYCPGGSTVYGGIAVEWVQRVEGAGGTAYRVITDTENSVLADPELLKCAAVDMVTESGVDVLFHARATAAIVPNGQVEGAIIESKSGRQAILAQVTIDATGDADVVAWSNGRYVTGTKGISLPFRVGNVDWDRYSAFRETEPDAVAKLDQEIRQQTQTRLPRVPNHRCGNDLAWINYWGPTGYSAIDVEHLSQLEVLLRQNIRRSVSFLHKMVPGFENCFLVDVASQIGTRDSRRIIGGYTLTMEDLNGGAAFTDSIGRMCKDPQIRITCDVPYRCLLPQGVSNLIVAGRPISVESDVHEATRLIPPALTTGEAAGTAAALAAGAGVAPADVDIARLQSVLRANGVHISVPVGR